jgi:hypothetical protein
MAESNGRGQVAARPSCRLDSEQDFALRKAAKTHFIPMTIGGGTCTGGPRDSPLQMARASASTQVVVVAFMPALDSFRGRASGERSRDESLHQFPARQKCLFQVGGYKLSGQ